MIKSKFRVISTMLVVIMLFLMGSTNAFAKEVDGECLEMEISTYSQTSLHQFYSNRPSGEYPVDWIQFTNSKLNISASATKGDQGNATSVTIKIMGRQNPNVNLYNVVLLSSTIPVNGNGYNLSSSLSIPTNYPVEIRVVVSQGCTANIAISAVSF